MTMVTASLRALLRPRRDTSTARLDEILQFAPATGAQEQLVLWFADWMSWMFERRGPSLSARVRFVSSALERNPEWKAAVRTAWNRLVKSVDLRTLFAYGGIPRHFSLWATLKAYLALRVLPVGCKTRDAERIILLAFREQDSSRAAQPDFLALLAGLLDDESREALFAAAREATIDLAHQLVACAHAPDMRSLQGARSPFAGLYEAVAAGPSTALLGRLRQCEKAVLAVRAEHSDRGANIDTSFAMTRMWAQLERLRMLTIACNAPQTNDPLVGATMVAAHLVRACTRRGHARWLLHRSTSLVVQNLVDTTAGVGHGYLDARHSAFGHAFLAGVGGGALMAVATMGKVLLSKVGAPPIYQGLLYGMNYAAIFCAAYLLHWTIATKLPSHTAAAIARSLQTQGGQRERVAGFLTAWRPAVRLQIAGVLGNLVAVVPLSIGLAQLARYIGGAPIVNDAKATKLLAEHALLGPSVLYAAVAGVLLWISSIIGATIDNWTRVNDVEDGLATNTVAMRRIGVHNARAVAARLVPQIGGLAGNAALGLMLGLVPAVASVFALPIDIRHVTVSAGSVSVAATNSSPSLGTVLSCAACVLLIGTVNIVVSFAIALWVTMRATDSAVDPRRTGMLLRIGLSRWLRGVQPSPVRQADLSRSGTSRRVSLSRCESA